MKLPIEQQAKTAAKDFVVLEVNHQYHVALPESWLNGSTLKFDLVAEGISASEAKGWTSNVALFLAPGSLKRSLRNMDSLHGTVNDVYTLVDEGYVDGRKAILAFQ